MRYSFSTAWIRLNARVNLRIEGDQFFFKIVVDYLCSFDTVAPLVQREKSFREVREQFLSETFATCDNEEKSN